MTTAKPADEGMLDTSKDEMEDVFATTFEEAAGKDLHPDVSKADSPDTAQPPPSEEAKGDEKVDAPTTDTPPPPDDKASPPADTKISTAPDSTTPPPEDENSQTYKQRWLVLQGIHKKEKEQLKREKEELEARLAAAAKPPDPPTEPPKKSDGVQKLQDFLDGLSEEERAELKEYDQEFDTISKMEGRKRTAALNKLRQEIMEEVSQIRAQLEPAAKLAHATAATQEKLSEETHFSALSSAHPDYEQYRDDGSILAWIESKPKYMRPGMLDTYAKGELTDVIQLLDDFKKENNIKSQTTQPPPDNVVKMDPKKAERKATMTPPNSRSTAVTTNVPATDDFEGAFDEALSKG